MTANFDQSLDYIVESVYIIIPKHNFIYFVFTLQQSYFFIIFALRIFIIAHVIKKLIKHF